MFAMSEIQLNETVSKNLLDKQGEIANAQGQIVELVMTLAAYGALPAALQQAAQKLAGLAKERDEALKAAASAEGVDLEAPDAGKWSWVMQENVIRKVA